MRSSGRFYAEALAEVVPPKVVVGLVDHVVLDPVGSQAGARLAQRVSPHCVVGGVDLAIAVVVALDGQILAKTQRSAKSALKCSRIDRRRPRESHPR